MTKSNMKEIGSKIDKKQLIVGIIILIFAILALIYGFMGDTATDTQPKADTKKSISVSDKASAAGSVEAAEAASEEEKQSVSLTFTATTDKDVEYLISYTTEEDMYFNGKNAFTHPIKKGTAEYTIKFPVEKILSFRMDFGMDSGKMTIKNFKLVGAQEEDISSPMYYEMMGKIQVGENNSFIVDDKLIPALIYHPEFKKAIEDRMKANEQPKAEAKEEAKPEAKEEAKTEAKEEAKPEAKEEAKEEAKTEAKEEAKK